MFQNDCPSKRTGLKKIMNCGKRSESWLGYDELFTMVNGAMKGRKDLVPSPQKRPKKD
jgi:hypothetical protein